MKKILITFFFLFYLAGQNYGADYIKVIFSNKDSVATASMNLNGTYQINFKDSNLVTLFSHYVVSDYSKEYPIADSFPDYMTPTLTLRLVYRIRLSNSQINQYKNLKASIDSLHSSDIDAVILMDSVFTLSTPPNDYYISHQWPGFPEAHDHLDLINALDAWDVTKGLFCIKVGITDQDFQHHEDLDNKVYETPRTAFIAASGVNNAHHGTEVAGMVGAETNNNLGLSSLGYNITMSYYQNSYSGIANAIYDGCKVVNCSWYAGISSGALPPIGPTKDIQALLDLARLNNVTIVAAAGNNNSGNATDYFYPASFDEVISVTSVGSQWNVGDLAHNGNWKDVHRKFPAYDPSNPSNYTKTHQHNSKVDICAPGYYVESCADNNLYKLDEGTSFAAPLVAAAAGLLYSINPFFTSSDIEKYLLNNAVNIYGVSTNSDFTGQLGAGRLNAGASLQAASTRTYNGPAYCINCPSETTYLTYTSAALNGYFYNKNIVAGSGSSSNSVTTSSSVSTDLIATTEIDLQPEFNAVATASSSFSARIQPCNLGLTAKMMKQRKALEKVNLQKNIETTDEFKIYPNPTKNILNVEIFSKSDMRFQLSIIDGLGKLLKTYTMESNNGKFYSRLNISNLQSGLYYISYENKSNKHFIKFIKG